MQVRIYKPIKNPMQSGRDKDFWVIEYIAAKNERFIEPLLYRVTTTNTMPGNKLYFDNKQTALEFAKQHQYEYEVIETEPRMFIKKSYANNFTRPMN